MNYLFFGNEQAGHDFAALYTLVAQGTSIVGRLPCSGCCRQRSAGDRFDRVMGALGCRDEREHDADEITGYGQHA